MHSQAVRENVLKHVDSVHFNLLQQVFCFNRRFQPVAKGATTFKVNAFRVNGVRHENCWWNKRMCRHLQN